MKHALKLTRPALSAAALFGLLTLPAWGHDGHGLPNLSHWHGTDVLGFVGAVVVATTVWFKGDK
jgi:hypothetical protein